MYTSTMGLFCSVCLALSVIFFLSKAVDANTIRVLLYCSLHIDIPLGHGAVFFVSFALFAGGGEVIIIFFKVKKGLPLCLTIKGPLSY